MPGPGQNQHCSLCRSHRQAKGVQSNTLQRFGKLLTRPTGSRMTMSIMWRCQMVLLYVHKDFGLSQEQPVMLMWGNAFVSWINVLDVVPSKAEKAEVSHCWNCFSGVQQKTAPRDEKTLGEIRLDELLPLRSWFHELLQHKTWVTVSL